MEHEDHIPSFFRFEDLRVYQKALNYYIWVVETTKAHTNTTDLSHMAKLFVQDALCIADRISKGSTRHKASFINYLKDAKMGIRKCVLQTSAAEQLGVINSEEAKQSREALMELTKMVGALITSLQRDQQTAPYMPKDKDSWE